MHTKQFITVDESYIVDSKQCDFLSLCLLNGC